MVRNVKEPLRQEKEKKNPSFSGDSFETTQQQAPPPGQLKANPASPASMGSGAEAGAMQLKANGSSLSAGNINGSDAFQLKSNADPTPQNQTKFEPSGGASMPAATLGKMNKAFNADFSGVKMVPNSPVAQKANAQALAKGGSRGGEVHFGKGKFNPDTEKGQELIGHELTHLLQQDKGIVKGTKMVNGMPVNDDQSKEQEADQMGRRAARGQKTGMNPNGNFGASASANGPLQAKANPAPFSPDVSQLKEKEGEGETSQLKQIPVGTEMAAPPSDSLPNDANGQTSQLKIAQLANEPGEGAAAGAPQTVVDITNGFRPPEDVAKYLEENHNKYKEINVKLGNIAAGKLQIKEKTKGGEGTPAVYQIKSGQGLAFSGIDFLNPLAAQGLIPVIAIDGANPEEIGGYLTIKKGETVYKDPKRLITEINNNLEPLGMLGISPLTVPSYENSVTNGVLTLMTPEFNTEVGGFMNATGKFGLVDGTFVFEINADVEIEGLANGLLNISRNEEGKFNGDADIDVSVNNLNGNIKVVYAEGNITGRGTANFDSEKFSGSVTMVFDEEAIANAAVHEGMGIETIGEENTGSEGSGKKVLVGFGSVTCHLTDWLTATANVGIDSHGHVTVHGQLVFPDQIELMEQKDKQKDLFDVEIKAGYGIPLVGQVFLFASVGMFVKAGFGPLVLKDIGMEGTYSTDPNVLQNFSITGALGISAYAMLGLRCRAGVGLTLLGHDVKAGIQCDASAGIQAYAEARPTFEYREVAADGGKKGEAHLKGHFEAAAQLFLELAGAFFVELDSPWWSPAPDETWEWPFGSVQYPLGDAGFGIGADVDWLVGSPDVPEVEFSPVEFDPDKFVSDMTKEPDNFGEKGKKGGEQNPEGKWQDQGGGGMDKDPKANEGPGSGLGERPQVDPKSLPDDQKYMRALAEAGDLAEEAKRKPAPSAVTSQRLDAIRDKYGISRMVLKSVGRDKAHIYVSHAGQNNSKNMIEVKLITAAERDRLFRKAADDLEELLKSQGDKETGAVSKSTIDSAAKQVDQEHDVIVDTKIIDAGKDWKAVGDIETSDRELTRKPQLEQQGKEAEGADKDEESQEAVEAKIQDLESVKKRFNDEDGDKHTLYFDANGTNATLYIASTPRTIEQYIDELAKQYTDTSSKEYKLVVEANSIIDGTGEYGIPIKKITSGDVDSIDRRKITNALTRLSEILIRLDAGNFDQDLEKLKEEALAKLGSAKYSYGGPHKSEVENLSSENKERGSTPQADPKGYNLLVGHNLTKNIKGQDKWVRMHMIPDQIGGDGNNRENLIPAPNSVNRGTRVASFENTLKNLILGSSDAQKRTNLCKDDDCRLHEVLPNVIWAKVEVTQFWPGKDTPNYDDTTFAKEIDFEGGMYFYRKGEWIKDPTERVVEFTVPVKEPDFDGEDSINLSATPSKSGLQNLVPELTATKVDRIREEGDSGPFKNLGDFKKRMVDRMLKRKLDQYTAERTEQEERTLKREKKEEIQEEWDGIADSLQPHIDDGAIRIN